MLFIRLIFCGLGNMVLILLTSISIAKAEMPYQGLAGQIISDYQHYYHDKPLFIRAYGLGAGGLMANSDIDPHVRNAWQHHLRGDLCNNVSDSVNVYSEIASYPIAVPLYLFSIWLSAQNTSPHWTGDLAVWANHSLRSLLLGAPEQILFSHLLGGGRPQTGSPEWNFFEHHRAVSGHAFYGALPLLNFAKQTSIPWLKGSLYALSVLPGVARINDDKHYLSQVWLGWWFAYCATNGVWREEIVSKKPNTWSIHFTPVENGIFLGMQTKF